MLIKSKNKYFGVDLSKHPIFGNFAIMKNLKKFFSKEEWGYFICEINNPLGDQAFDACIFCLESNILTIGFHYDEY